MCSSSGMNRIFSDWLCAPHTRDTDRIEWKEAVRRLGGQAQTILGSHTHPLAFALPLDPPSLPRLLYKNPSSSTLDLIFLWHGAPASFLVLPKAFRDFGRLPVHGGHQPLQHGPPVPPQQPAPPDLQPHHPVHLAPVPGRGAAGLLCGLPAEGPVPGRRAPMRKWRWWGWMTASPATSRKYASWSNRTRCWWRNWTSWEGRSPAVWGTSTRRSWGSSAGRWMASTLVKPEWRLKETTWPQTWPLLNTGKDRCVVSV